MNCPNCGAINAPGSKFCVGCGGPLPVEAQQFPQQPIPQQPKKPATPSAKVDFGAIKNQLFGILAPIGAKVKGIMSNKKLFAGIVGGAVLLLALIIVCAILGGGNGFVEYKTMIGVISTDDNEYTVIVDKKPLSTTISSESYPSTQTSLDGKAAAILADGKLYGVSGKKVKELASDVISFELSVNGKYVAYATREEGEEEISLYLAKVSNPDSAKEITDELVSKTDYAISPDGKSVAYFVDGGEDSEDELMLFKGSKSDKIADDGGTLFGLSNGGKYIYVGIAEKSKIDVDIEDVEDFFDDAASAWEYTLYTYNKKGNREKLGTFNGDDVAFNDDHTQVMFLNMKGQTYIANKGKKAEEKASSDALELVLPSNSESMDSRVTDSLTYPVSTFYDHVYTTSDNEVWLIKKKSDKSQKLVSKASNVQLDANAEYVYYNYDHDELRVVKISHGEKASEKYKTIIRDYAPSVYYVTSNRKFVYFMEKDSVYSVNGKKGGIPKEVSEDLESYITVGGNDTCYYIVDGDLYACSNGKKGKKILGDINHVSTAANGNVYATSDDAIYCSTGAKKPKKVVDIG